MTIESVPTTRGKLRTVRCSLCGAKRGEDFSRFSTHLEKEHTFDDVEVDGGGL